MNNEVFSVYKPLKNYLGKLEVKNALSVIWAYINYSQVNTFSFPYDIEADKNLIANKGNISGSIHEWELSFLAREVLANGNLYGHMSVDLRQWRYMSGAIDHIRKFENEVYLIYGTAENIHKDLRRIAHRQFPWQEGFNKSLFIRYFKIYNNPRIQWIVQETLGITLQQWYVIGTAVLGLVFSHPKFSVDSDISFLNVTKSEFDKFFEFISADIGKIQSIIKRDVKYDDEFVYTFNPLEYYPLIFIDGSYYCPVINFLVWRITSGIYFDLVSGRKDFGHHFGFAFQDYVEEISRKILDDNITRVIPEKNGSVDLILSQSKAAFFVEAKTKRMKNKSKSQLLSDKEINSDLKILAEAIGQVYATIKDYLDNKYVHFPRSATCKIYPIVVTLEEWNIFGDDAEKILKMTGDDLLRRQLPVGYLNEMPFVACSVKDYEVLLQILNEFSIEVVMEKWQPLNVKGHNFGQFLRTEFKGQYKTICDYFPNDFDAIYKV